MATAEDSDRRAIREINQRDTEAILTGDLATITSQWTEDFTVIPESGSIVRGRSANVQIALRILQKQPDGSWKMHRTMTSIDKPNQPDPPG